jgi:prevent-host-death family protein
MVTRMTATEARVGFGEMMRRAVEQDETIIVERGGRPMVVVLSIEEYERLAARSSLRAGDALDRAIAIGNAVRERRGADTMPHSQDLLDLIRSEREAGRDGLR